MNFSALGRGEILAAAGGLLLALGLFLPWYETSENPNGNIDGARGALSGWEVHDVQRWLLLAAAAAPVILVWIVIREHELSWPRGEMTAVVAIAAFGLVVYAGMIDRPGNTSDIALRSGWFAALLGVVLMAAGGAHRASKVERPRRPPGVLR